MTHARGGFPARIRFRCGVVRDNGMEPRLRCGVRTRGDGIVARVCCRFSEMEWGGLGVVTGGDGRWGVWRGKCRLSFVSGIVIHVCVGAWLVRGFRAVWFLMRLSRTLHSYYNDLTSEPRHNPHRIYTTSNPFTNYLPLTLPPPSPPQTPPKPPHTSPSPSIAPDSTPSSPTTSSPRRTPQTNTS